MLPVISRRISQSFKCDNYDNGENGVSYLSADTSIDCASDRYKGMMAFASIMMIIYPMGCPLLMLVSLYRHHDALNPPCEEEAAVIAKRKEDPRLAEDPLTAFSLLYRPKFWWFECYSTLRRLMLTCVVLCFDQLGSTVVYVTCVAIVTLVIEQECKPYVNAYVTGFCNCCNWQVVMMILYLLCLDADFLEGPRGVVFSALLMLSNMFLMAVIFVDSHQRMSLQRAWGGGGGVCVGGGGLTTAHQA